ncbi:HAMP domain-containing histidine kinase [Aquabacterium sp. A7-Y]|uniref:sensor histidine kinase n=1 Tax=Aquabacterium sp. A7-Y TaxID=1349605 RepID=UPI00223DB3E6|nr:HAMP domain-containing sensor histidine kinase [Aquabacterium sp. A7-Y]MCW7537346.1 HAMP domain-containing histidine kinase [Aquabacterium sp. A7-Y]
MSSAEELGPSGHVADAIAAPVTELQNRLIESQRAVQARDDFLLIAAHELRSPMNALAMQLAAIERLAARQQLERIQHELQRARRMLANYVKRATVLLDVTRLNAGNFLIRPEAVRLHELVADVVELHAEEFAFHGIAVRTDIDPGIVGHWDAQAIEEILSNLLSNAVKYGGGSPITIRACMGDGKTACLSVADGGPGIDEGDRRRIFEKFERVVSGANVNGGFGLGLWIVGRLVEAHHGSIEVEAGPNTGSCFTVHLPLVPPHTDSSGLST